MFLDVFHLFNHIDDLHNLDYYHYLSNHMLVEVGSHDDLFQIFHLYLCLLPN